LISEKRVTPEQLRSFFQPKNIALIGATDNSLWSISTYENLKNHGFSGSIYCVNPNKKMVHGEKAYPSIRDIKKPIDLAYIMVSTKHLLQLMQEAADANVQNLVLLTSGFSEIGEKGKELEKKVLKLAEENNQIILGPNGNGFIHITEKITPYGLPLPQSLKPGSVGVVLQSGALASQLVTLSETRHIGLSLLVSMGNETMVSMTDVIDYLIEDKNTKVIALFIESIRQTKEFARVAQKALESGKPIVALKIGRSEESARSAMAHTGALVGDDVVNDAAFRQLGVIRVHSLEDLMTTAGLLGHTLHLPGRNMGVVTPSGGACDIIADRSADENILLPDFAPETVKQLESIVPDFSTVNNPLDITGYVVVDRTLMFRTIDVVINDPHLDFVFCLLDPPRVKPDNADDLLTQYKKLKERLDYLQRPVIFVMNVGVDVSEFGKTLMEETNINFVGGMEHGMTAIGNALWWNEQKNNIEMSFKLNQKTLHSSDNNQMSSVQWSEYNAREYLIKQDVPVVPGKLATNSEKAITAAKEVGYPVVMKIQSELIAHKSDVGGVALNLQTDEEVKKAYQNMIDKVNSNHEASNINEVLISPMRKGGTEILVGLVKDPLWGYVLTVGLGGIFVEIFKDTSLRILPVNQQEIVSMLKELKSAPLLSGARGQAAADICHIANVIYKIIEAADKLSGLEVLEVNPLFVKGETVEALDAFIHTIE